MPQITDQELKQGYGILGKDVVDKTGKVVRSDPAPVTSTGTQGPVSTSQQTPPGQLPPLGDQSASTGGIFNYQTAVRLALNEATSSRKGSQMSTLAPYTAGLPNNALSQVIGSINQGANLDATGTYKSFTDAQSEEQKIKQQQQQNTLDIVKAMANDGSLGDLPDGALLAMSKASGIDAGQLLAWRTGVKSKNEQEVEKAKQDIELVKSQIAENVAQAGAASRSNQGNGSSGSAFAFTADDKRRLLGSGLTNTEITAIETNLKKGNSIDTILGASTLSDSEKTAVKNTMTNVSGTTTANNEAKSVQFLSPEWFWQNFTREQLMAAAKSQGIVTGGMFNKQGDPDAYIQQMMATINRDRNGGMTDQQIYSKLLAG